MASYSLPSLSSNRSQNKYHLLLTSVVVLVAEGFHLPTTSQLARPALAGLVSTLIAGLAYYHGLRRVPAERAAILSYLEPLAAMLVGWVLLREPPSYAAWGGGALILAGGLVVATQSRAAR